MSLKQLPEQVDPSITSCDHFTSLIGRCSGCSRCSGMSDSSVRCSLRSSCSVSLHERFSQVLPQQQVSWPRVVTFDPVQVQQSSLRAPPPVVLLLETERAPPPGLQPPRQRLMKRRRRSSVWTRLGWQQVARRPPGFWSFRNKYRWSARFPGSTCRRPVNLCGRLGGRRLLTGRKIQKLTAGRTRLRLYLPGGGASATRGRGQSAKEPPTRKQLDAQLDEYMSRSRRRLDQELDEYMAMAGQSQWG